jgi:hypothetical protein
VEFADVPKRIFSKNGRVDLRTRESVIAASGGGAKERYEDQLTDQCLDPMG